LYSERLSVATAPPSWLERRQAVPWLTHLTAGLMVWVVLGCTLLARFGSNRGASTRSCALIGA